MKTAKNWTRKIAIVHRFYPLKVLNKWKDLRRRPARSAERANVFTLFIERRLLCAVQNGRQGDPPRSRNYRCARGQRQASCRKEKEGQTDRTQGKLTLH